MELGNGAAQSEIHGKGVAELKGECVGEWARDIAVLCMLGVEEIWPELIRFLPAAAILLELGMSRRKVWRKRMAISRQPNNPSTAPPMQPDY